MTEAHFMILFLFVCWSPSVAFTFPISIRITVYVRQMPKLIFDI